jgi:hypothetical protein
MDERYVFLVIEKLIPMVYDQKDLLQATELYPSLWMMQNDIKTSSGLPFEFDNHLFMRDIVDDMSPLQVGLKPPQIGWSETLMVKTFYMASKKEKDIIFTLPTASDRDDMVGSKVNRIIAQNPILQKMVKDHDTIEQKVVGSHIIHYRGTFTVKAAMMVSSDLNVHDETDSSNPEVITQYENRLEAKANGMRWYFSHPSLSGHGVDVYWQLSNKREWFITCASCGGEQILTWPDNIDLIRQVYICALCKADLSDENRKHGVWKPTAKGDFSGYHISQMMCAWITAKKIIDAFNDPMKDKQFFYNYVLGLPYIGSEDRIEPKTVLQNCVDDVNDYYAKDDRVIIGCDTGHGIHYVLRNQQGVFLYGHETEITATKDPYDKIAKFLDTFDKSVAIFDQGGDLIGVRKLQAKYPGRVFLVFYRKDRKSNEYVEWGIDDEFGTVRVDRNRQITIMVEQLRDIGRYRFNGTKEEWAEFASHFGYLYREEITTDAKPGKDDKSLLGAEYIWKRSGPDHFCFIAGTKIMTDSGERNIEDIGAGDMVLTRKGFRKVYHSGITKRDARVLTAYFSNGSVFTATPDHPIITDNGQIRLDSITRHAKLYTWQKAKSSYTKGLHTEGIQTHLGAKQEYISFPMELSARKDNLGFISKYGLMPMELFLRGLSFIIKMAIHLITRLQTWYVNRELFIRANTLKRTYNGQITLEEMRNIWNALEANRTNGSRLPRVKGIHALMPSKLLSWLNPKLLFVLSAILKQLHNGVRAVSSVPPDVQIVGLHENIEKKDVINIAVEEEAEYFANGILVSNCHALLYSDIGMQHFNHEKAKIFGAKSIFDGIHKAQVVSDGGVQLMWPK